MRFTVYGGNKIISSLTGGMLGAQAAPKTPNAQDSSKADQDAADEAARKLRARERMRSGVVNANTSGVSSGEFASTGSQKKSLLG